MPNVSPVLIASGDARLVKTNMMMPDLIASGDARLVKTNMVMFGLPPPFLHETHGRDLNGTHGRKLAKGCWGRDLLRWREGA